MCQGEPLHFPRRLRLRSQKEFEAVRKGGRSVRDAVLRLGFCKSSEVETRLGLAVSRRLGGAVIRNRIKRILREAWRHHRHLFPPGLDVVIVPVDGKLCQRLEYVSASLSRLAPKVARELGARFQELSESCSCDLR